MSDRNYPLPPDMVRPIGFDDHLTAYVAIMLEELGFPKLLDTDMTRLHHTLQGFLQSQAPHLPWQGECVTRPEEALR